jgi:hypothetical protein
VFQSVDQPKPLSGALYAMAPHHLRPEHRAWQFALSCVQKSVWLL